MLNHVALEALLVAIAGIAIALVANALSPRGLDLNTNYFPAGLSAPLNPPTSAAAPAASANGTHPPENAAVMDRLRQRGLQAIGHDKLVELIRNGSTAEGSVILVDARDDRAYTASHIPGAWQFHHYRAETFLPTLVPRCLTALKVIVYCNGGDCEDSEFAAVILRDAGVPPECIFVYTGGMQEWARQNAPVEVGPRQEP